MNKQGISRRRFMAAAGGIAVAAGFGTPAVALAAATKASNNVRQLAMTHIHTGESANLVYFENGQYINDVMTELSYLLRDFRTGEVLAMDPNVLDQLYLLSSQFGYRKHMQIIGGYRSPKTNEKLRQNSNGVAKKSYHMKGQAIDVGFPGLSLATARKAAISLKAGGVGYYPKSGFLHLDSGPVRSWG
ncbi:DUF882 domain-containing protein [Neiella marina]|uniref:Murein endopeptidase K n=1 Tax=Neiella holothuriorum TaxID=2870530 RepID=A0ABS7EBF7_9GAMM|nr:DUF882 domain-containing protein [Neiella holothuriorum]MBW8189631.1 DUF882 domain-containing protein [Neiella holothuriorum]